jgi:hypothetical protein
MRNSIIKKLSFNIGNVNSRNGNLTIQKGYFCCTAVQNFPNKGTLKVLIFNFIKMLGRYSDGQI